MRPEHLLSLGVAEDIEAGHAGGGSGIILSLLSGWLGTYQLYGAIYLQGSNRFIDTKLEDWEGKKEEGVIMEFYISKLEIL